MSLLALERWMLVRAICVLPRWIRDRVRSFLWPACPVTRGRLLGGTPAKVHVFLGSVLFHKPRIEASKSPGMSGASGERQVQASQTWRWLAAFQILLTRRRVCKGWILCTSPPVWTLPRMRRRPFCYLLPLAYINKAGSIYGIAVATSAVSSSLISLILA